MAQRKVRDTVAEAAREQAAARHADETDAAEAARGPCDVGLVFALKIEAAALRDRLTSVVTTRGKDLRLWQGELAGRRVALIVSGPGREAAAKATEALIDGHRPRWMLSAGFAGGLSPKLKRRDVLMVDQVVDAEGQRLDLELNVDPDALAAVEGVHVGRLLTVDRVVRLPDEKCELGRAHDALAVDMESFAVAEVCGRRRVRLLDVRVVYDAVADELPPDVENLMTQKSIAGRMGAVTGAVWRRPSSVKDMLKLREDALEAAKRLAKFTQEMIEQR